MVTKKAATATDMDEDETDIGEKRQVVPALRDDRKSGWSQKTKK